MNFLKYIFRNHKVVADIDPVTENVEPVNSAGLTVREVTITKLVVEGYRNHEIAANLAISEKAVKDRLQTIFSKLGVTDRLECAIYAIHHRLI